MLLRRSNVRETNSSFRRTSRNVIEKTCRPPSLYRCTSKSTFSDLLLFPDISLSRLYTLSLSFSASDIQFPFIRNFSRRTDKTREGFVISKPVVRGDCFFSFLPFFLFYLRAFFFEKLPLLFSLLARVLLLLLLASFEQHVYFSGIERKKERKEEKEKRAIRNKRYRKGCSKQARISEKADSTLRLNTAKFAVLERREIFSGAFQPREKSSLSTNLARGCAGYYWAGSMPTARWISRQTRPSKGNAPRRSRVSKEARWLRNGTKVANK